METILNKENARPGVQKHNAMAVQKKKPLEIKDTNMHVENINPVKTKQPLGIRVSKENIKNKENILQDPRNISENVGSNKENKNIVNPIVPCNQFKAFKVYEDETETYEERLARIEEKLKDRVKNSGVVQVYKGTAEDRYYTKTEIAELERKKRERKEEKPVTTITTKVEETSSCLSNVENLEPTVKDVIVGGKRFKDLFFHVDEYRSDIYSYLKRHELQNRAKPGYMKKQPDVTSNMRTILVDWLVEVAEEYQLHTETLYLAVNYIDRFLSYMSVVRAKFQLVGTAAMFLASKYEEIYPPEVSEFVYITDNSYTKKQVLRMEHLILKVLGFDLSIPTPLTFITAMCVSNQQSEKIKYLAMYLSELSLLNGEIYLEFLPSVLAASAIALARHTLEEVPWTEELKESTGYTLKQLEAGIEFLNHMFKTAPTLAQHAVQDKYNSKKCMHVSTLKPRESLINFT